MNSKNWCKKHLIQIKQRAGARYAPELNVNLPISEIFDAISRSEKFYTTIRINYGELLRQFRHISTKYVKGELQKSYDQIKKEIDSLFKLIENIKVYNTNKIPWDKINKEAKTLLDNLREFASKLREEKDQVKNIKTTAKKDGSYQQSPSEKLNSDQALELISKVIDYYRNNAKGKERIGNMLDRIGIDTLKAAVCS